MPQPLTRKEREFARREQDILAAAIDLFSGPDWESVTVEQIAKQAEIGKGTVYKHFASKEEIYARVTLEFSSRILQAFRDINQQQSVDQIMREILRIAFSLYLASPAHARVAHYCKRRDFRERLTDALKNDFENMDQAFELLVAQILENGMEQGVIPRRPMEHLFIGLEATFDGAMSMIWNGEVDYVCEMKQEDFVNVICEYMLAGIMAPAPHMPGH